MDLYDIAVARKLSSGGGGGGGSSDFSTASIVVTNDTPSPVDLGFNVAIDTEVDFMAGNFESSVNDGSQGTFIVVLYKGEGWGNITILEPSPTVATTGGVEYNAEEGTLLITGDCTITIS